MNLTLWMALYGVGVAIFLFIRRKKKKHNVYLSVAMLLISGILGAHGYGASIADSNMKALTKKFRDCGGVEHFVPHHDKPWVVNACGKTYNVDFKGRAIKSVEERIEPKNNAALPTSLIATL